MCVCVTTLTVSLLLFLQLKDGLKDSIQYSLFLASYSKLRWSQLVHQWSMPSSDKEAVLRTSSGEIVDGKLVAASVVKERLNV